MAKSIMILGTMSNVGKSVITAGLCRIFKEDGYKTAPFKSQNMALNSYITIEGLEMGRAQAMQAEFAGILPDVRMNPVLLKPTTEKGSQVIVNGEVLGFMNASEYFAYKKNLLPDIMRAYNSLSLENDIIVIEGAGSPAEINLKKDDIVNTGLAKMTGSPCILVGDIDRGGVFASLYGTVELLDSEERGLIKGVIINKFRGDIQILKPGLKQLSELVKLPVLGVVPYSQLNIDDEDSLSWRLNTGNETKEIDIAVMKLPKISNFTDFNVFQNRRQVSLRYVKSAADFKNPDLCIIPGTKNTAADIIWLRECGLESEILKHAASGKPVFGICGGYQMLGRKLSDPENIENGGTVPGFSLLDFETVFTEKKTRTRAAGRFNNIDGVFKGLSGKRFEGYEIHMGKAVFENEHRTLTTIESGGGIKKDGQFSNNIYGTYIHGIFDKENIAGTIIKALCEQKRIKYNEEQWTNERDEEYNRISCLLRKSLDMDLIYSILENGEVYER